MINGSRRKRIARGSGTSVEEVNRLLKQFVQMRKMLKQLGAMQGGGKGMRGAMKALRGRYWAARRARLQSRRCSRAGLQPRHRRSEVRSLKSVSRAIWRTECWQFV